MFIWIMLLKQLGPLLPLVEGLIPGDTAFKLLLGRQYLFLLDIDLENLPSVGGND